jgi:hypothetical protein
MCSGGGINGIGALSWSLCKSAVRFGRGEKEHGCSLVEGRDKMI